MNTDHPSVIAWGLWYDGTGGLKEEVRRRLMVIDQFVAYGYTDADGVQFSWMVTEHEDADAARAQAINLTAISEEWGTRLDEEPRVRDALLPEPTMHVWLRGLVDGDQPQDSLDSLYQTVMAAGRSLAA